MRQTNLSSTESIEEIKVVRLGILDAPRLAALEGVSIASPWSEATLRSELDREITRAFGAFCQAKIVGYLLLWQVADAAEVVRLGVDPLYRRAGIARRLCRYACNILSAGSVREVWLEVRESNSAARQLYSSCGFEYHDRRLSYYADTGEDALTMRLRL